MSTRVTKDGKRPGVYSREIPSKSGVGTDKMFYIMYRRGGRGSKLIKEPVGKVSEGMTASKAAIIRADRISGKQDNNKETRRKKEKCELLGVRRLTLGTLWEAYDSVHASRKCRKTDACNVLKFGTLLDRDPRKLTTEDIVSLRMKLENTRTNAAWLKDTGARLSAQTVKHVLGLLKRLLNFGVKMGAFQWPEGVVFDMPHLDNQKTELMTADQLRQYCEALESEPDIYAKCYLQLVLYTGIRKSAALKLMWEDVDFERGLLTLRGENAKSDKTEIIPLSSAAIATLKRLPRTDGVQWLFPSPRDNAKHREDFALAACRARDMAGLPKEFRRVHGLRHEFASLLAQSGAVTLFEISKLLTHGDTSITQRYAHLMPDKLRGAADIAADAISRANTPKR